MCTNFGTLPPTKTKAAWGCQRSKFRHIGWYRCRCCLRLRSFLQSQRDDLVPRNFASMRPCRLLLQILVWPRWSCGWWHFCWKCRFLQNKGRLCFYAKGEEARAHTPSVAWGCIAGSSQAVALAPRSEKVGGWREFVWSNDRCVVWNLVNDY